MNRKTNRTRDLEISLSFATRAGIGAAVRDALTRSDREAYRRKPERVDPSWVEAEAWNDEHEVDSTT